MKLAVPTLDALVMTPPPSRAQPSHLRLVKCYDFDLCRYAATMRGYTLHLRIRGEERARDHSLG
jgi:hypothetical protein